MPDICGLADRVARQTSFYTLLHYHQPHSESVDNPRASVMGHCARTCTQVDDSGVGVRSPERLASCVDPHFNAMNGHAWRCPHQRRPQIS
jgi:hypothetical protein